MKKLFLLILSCSMIFCYGASAWAKDIIHDAEYYIIEAQNGERWGADDKRIDAKLAELRKANGGKPPNIVYILLDDVSLSTILCKPQILCYKQASILSPK